MNNFKNYQGTISLKGIVNSFKNAFHGFRVLLRSEHNLYIQLGAALFITLTGFYFSITATQWMLQTLIIGLVIFAELVNTAIEKIMDIIVEEGDKINLNLNHELKDPVSAESGDVSTETLTLEFSGMGEYAAFYLDGDLISGTDQVTDNGSGNYIISGLSSEEAEKLSFVQAKDDLSNVQVRAQTAETAGGDPSDWTDWEDVSTSGVTEQYSTTGDDTLLWTGEGIDGFGGEDTIQLRFGESVSDLKQRDGVAVIIAVMYPP